MPSYYKQAVIGHFENQRKVKAKNGYLYCNPDKTVRVRFGNRVFNAECWNGKKWIPGMVWSYRQFYIQVLDLESR